MYALCVCSGSERPWRPCWTWRVVCWGRCRGASRWGAEGSRRPPPAAPSHTALTPYLAGESPLCTQTHLGCHGWGLCGILRTLCGISLNMLLIFLLGFHDCFYFAVGQSLPDDAENLNPSGHTGWRRHVAWTLCLMILEVGLWRTLCFCF